MKLRSRRRLGARTSSSAMSAQREAVSFWSNRSQDFKEQARASPALRTRTSAFPAKEKPLVINPFPPPQFSILGRQVARSRDYFVIDNCRPLERNSGRDEVGRASHAATGRDG